MEFEVLPVIDIMIELYEKPRSIQRFKDYIALVEGDTNGNMAMPLHGFNPMGKEHVLEMLKAFKKMDAEGIMATALKEVNIEVASIKDDEPYRVAFSLSDDLKGGWTNRCTADYDSKFKTKAMLARHFCMPIFWTSEPIDASTKKMIIERTKEYCYRTIYRLKPSRMLTVEDHVMQEKFVAEKIKYKEDVPFSDIDDLRSSYLHFRDNTRHDVILNFLYGDAAMKELGHKANGIKEPMAGFKFARYLSAGSTVDVQTRISDSHSTDGTKTQRTIRDN